MWKKDLVNWEDVYNNLSEGYKVVFIIQSHI